MPTRYAHRLLLRHHGLVWLMLALFLHAGPVFAGCSDADGDGVCDVDDNCVATPNPDQLDTYGDASGPASGDACEPFNDRLNVTKVKIRAGASGSTKGRVAVKGDFVLHAGEMFTGAAGMTMRIADALDLDQTAPAPSGTIACVSSRRAIRCKGLDPVFSGKFKASSPSPTGEVAVRYSLKVSKLDLAPLFDAPLGVTVTDLTSGLELHGKIFDCALANGSIHCREY